MNKTIPLRFAGRVINAPRDKWLEVATHFAQMYPNERIVAGVSPNTVTLENTVPLPFAYPEGYPQQ